jgi:hypothetical protein
MIGLRITRADGESWRECAERYAARFGLQSEVLEQFDSDVANGTAESDAALSACIDWDIAELATDV